MSSYFRTLDRALKDVGLARPALVLDLDRLDANIEAVKRSLSPALKLRLVDKSLPSLPLLQRIAQACGTERIMGFHLPVTEAVLDAQPQAECLLGKPMPVAGVRELLSRRRELAGRIVWLIDGETRLGQYGALADELGLDLSVCLEVDIGLHRGGLADPVALKQVLVSLSKWRRLACCGVMAYEAHIGHIPAFLGGPAGARRKSLARLQAFVAELGADQRRIINLGGSSTALGYDAGSGANEVSMGSAFVKPTDFDVPSLAQLQPAIFIATPVLKVVDVQLPGLDGRSSILQALGRLPRRGLFTYGGKWMAQPAWPEGMHADSNFGQSTNQQFYGLPRDATIEPDDFAFFRPTQSEFVLQQFGAIQLFSGGRMVGNWPALPFS